MKYIQKFNESKENYITQSDFELIEDLFLFLSDQGKQVKYDQAVAFGSSGWASELKEVINSKVEKKCNFIIVVLNSTGNQNGEFLKIIETPRNPDLIPKPYIIYTSSGNEIRKDHTDYLPIFNKMFGFSPKRDSDIIYPIKNLEDLTKSDGPFPKSPRTQHQKVLQKLDPEYKIKNDLVDILYRTKGLDHYGFKWELSLECNLLVYIDYDWNTKEGILNKSHVDISVKINLKVKK